MDPIGPPQLAWLQSAMPVNASMRGSGALIQGDYMLSVRFALAAAALVASTFVQAAGYNYTALTPSGATSSDAWDVNNLGQVVGSYSSDGFSNERGYLWSAGVFTTLAGPEGALSTSALGVSDSGVVVGSYIDSQVADGTGGMVLGNWRGYIFQGGVYTRLDLPGAEATLLRGISPDGRYVSGSATFSNGGSPGFVLDRTTGHVMFVGSRGADAWTVLQGINDLGQVVGDERVFDPVSTTLTRTSFIFDLATGVRVNQTLPGTERSVFRDINDAGLVAGFVTLDQTSLGFAGTPASFQTFAYGSNTLLEGINNAGWLVGSYVVAEGQSQAFLLTPVPEPAVLALWLLGLTAVGLRVRRRN
ncbi:PEP-CTERM sorting domain-containing protein [Roseateles sp.]|uniref:PEP-CTERM sorting domain-containing protein n=1 Tax=Roseateles sp. TaxID=1971397 RepID=UPI0039E8704E